MSNDQQVHGEFSISPWSGRGTLEQMVGELQRQLDTKVDFVCDTRGLKAVVETTEDDRRYMRLQPVDRQVGEFIASDGLRLTPEAMVQVATRQTPKIPTRFFRELFEQQPVAAVRLVNELMAKAPSRRLLRCLDGNVRAFLSDRYRVMDNYDLAVAALGVAREHGGEVVEASLSDTKMRIKITSRSVFDAIDEERKAGDRGSWYVGGMGDQKYLRRVGANSGGQLPGGPGTVHPVVTISNSETGQGGLNVRVGILRAICFNIATVEDVACNIHLGERLEEGIFTAETISAESKSIMLKARDGIKAAFKPEVFKRLVARCRDAESDRIEAPSAAVDALVSNTELKDEHRDEILSHFIRDYSPTRYGLAQAVARFSQEVEDVEASSSMEDYAGSLIGSGELLK